MIVECLNVSELLEKARERLELILSLELEEELEIEIINHLEQEIRKLSAKKLTG